MNLNRIQLNKLKLSNLNFRRLNQIWMKSIPIESFKFRLIWDMCILILMFICIYRQLGSSIAYSSTTMPLSAISLSTVARPSSSSMSECLIGSPTWKSTFSWPISLIANFQSASPSTNPLKSKNPDSTSIWTSCDCSATSRLTHTTGPINKNYYRTHTHKFSGMLPEILPSKSVWIFPSRTNLNHRIECLTLGKENSISKYWYLFMTWPSYSVFRATLTVEDRPYTLTVSTERKHLEIVKAEIEFQLPDQRKTKFVVSNSFTRTGLKAKNVFEFGTALFSGMTYRVDSVIEINDSESAFLPSISFETNVKSSAHEDITMKFEFKEGLGQLAGYEAKVSFFRHQTLLKNPFLKITK